MVGLQRGKYFARNPVVYFFLRMVDVVMAALPCHTKTIGVSAQNPNRLLLCNGAHLGDMMLMLTVIPAIKRVWPEVEIGVLAGSWSKPLVEGHPDISYVHYVDHWKLSRTSRPFWSKMRKHFSLRRKAIRDIRSVGYDVAVDFYFFFPNAAILLSQVGIHTRLGYTSGGFGALYTHPLDWSPKNQSVVQYHLDLLGIFNSGFVDAIPDPHAGIAAVLTGQFAERVVKPLRLPEPGYVLLHPGTGNAVKEWPMESWRELLRQLINSGHRVVISGSGARECVCANQIVSGFSGVINLCGQLDWSGFVSLVQRANVLVGVDSVAGHVAAAVDTPCVVLPAGMNNPILWRPLGDQCEYLITSLHCAPCYRKRGCESMACIREITLDRVLMAITSLIDSEK